MTRLDALKKLAADVETGNWPSWIIAANALGLEPDDKHIRAHDAFHGSLDAALALHEAVLPGFHYSIDSEDRNGVCVFDHLMGNAQVAHSETASRAWLLAILRALIAQEEDQ